jgi:cytochrome c553
MSIPHLFVAVPLLTALVAGAAEHTAPSDSAADVYGPCAACHGDLGQGGKRGEYPSLAGQRPAYIEQQLRNFRSRERFNLPMLPYTQERELSDADIMAVSAYLASITLQTQFPDFKDTDDALTRLEAMEKVMIIPRLEGDLANGKLLYMENCAHCHGQTAKGSSRFPMLAGQYTQYLLRQIDLYLKGVRPHDNVADDDDDDDDDGDGKRQPSRKANSVGVLGRLAEKDINDIFAYITHLQDATP